MRFFVALAASFMLASLAVAQPTARPVLTGESRIVYNGTSPLHDWSGTSRQVSGTLRLDLSSPSRSRVLVEAPVTSFDSGNRTRDRNMRSAMEASQFRTVRFASRSIAPVSWQGRPGARRGTWRVAGDLTVHGRTRPLTVTMDVREERGRFVARGQFSFDLSDFGVDRPGIGPVKISDTIGLDLLIRSALP